MAVGGEKKHFTFSASIPTIRRFLSWLRRMMTAIKKRNMKKSTDKRRCEKMWTDGKSSLIFAAISSSFFQLLILLGPHNTQSNLEFNRVYLHGFPNSSKTSCPRAAILEFQERRSAVNYGAIRKNCSIWVSVQTAGKNCSGNFVTDLANAVKLAWFLNRMNHRVRPRPTSLHKMAPVDWKLLCCSRLLVEWPRKKKKDRPKPKKERSNNGNKLLRFW